MLPWESGKKLCEAGLFLLWITSGFFSVQKVLVPDVAGGLEYAPFVDISVYAADIAFLGFMMLFILNNIIQRNATAFLWMFHVEQYILLLLMLSVCLSLVHAVSVPLGLVAMWRLMQGIVLFLLIQSGYFAHLLFHVKQVRRYIFVPRETDETSWSDSSTWNNGRLLLSVLIFLGILNSLLAIIQAILQRSVGVHWIGESVLSAENPGVATIIWSGSEYIRGYGFFVHPNILGAFLGFLLLILLFSNQESKYCSTGNTCWQKFHVEQIFGGLILVGILVSLSKSALIVLLAVLIWQYRYLFHVKQLLIAISRRAVSQMFHEEQSRKRMASIHRVIQCMFHVKQRSVLQGRGIQSEMFHGEQPVDFADYSRRSFRLLFHVKHVPPVASLLILFVGIWWVTHIQSFSEREFHYLTGAYLGALGAPWGIGIGNSVAWLGAYMGNVTPQWLLQPAHSLYLGVYIELGVLGLLLFVIFLLQQLNVPRGTFMKHSEAQAKNPRLAHVLVVYLLLLGCFDHYFWDIPQGQHLFWMILGIAAWMRKDRSGIWRISRKSMV